MNSLQWKPPAPPKDEYVKALYLRYNLGPNPNLLQIEPVAIELFEDPTTRIPATELILGRHLGAEEITKIPLLKMAHHPFDLEPKYRFLAAAQQRINEDNKEE